MMKFTLYLISAILLINPIASGQSDQEAIKVLDKFSATATGAPSVFMKFNFVTVDQTEKTNDTLTGSIIISKDKYRLNLPDNIIWFDGVTSWSYLPAEKEVTINKADKKDNSFQNRPSAIFSMYKSGYKCRLIEERPDSYIIDLYPEDIKSNLLRVRLSVGRQTMNLRSLEYKQKDGIVKTLLVVDYDLKQKPGPDSFVYPRAKYKGVEVIDMR